MMVLGQETVDLTSTVFTEAYYFFTVAIMWLLHVGFMTYEAGVSRRKNVMATAMKNILTIAVVTPTFYYLGWWVYFCFEEGILPTGSADGANSVGSALYFCGDGYGLPWDGSMGPHLGDNITAFSLIARQHKIGSACGRQNNEHSNNNKQLNRSFFSLLICRF